MGILKAIEPMFPKEAIRPAIVVTTATDPFAFGPFAKNGSQASTNPAINGRKGPPITVFEVPEPTYEGSVYVIYDGCQAVTMATSGLLAKRVFELLQAFLAGPTCATLEMVAEKVKTHTTNRGVDQTRLLGMKTQFLAGGQLLRKAERCFGFGVAAAQDDKVVGISHHVKASLGHGNIDRVQIQIGEQRADHGPLRSPFLRSPQIQAFQNILLEESLYQGQHPSIPDVPANVFHKLGVRDAIKVRFEIRIHDIDKSCFKKLLDGPEGILTSVIGAESIATFNKLLLEDRLDHKAKGGLDHAITNTGNTEWPLVLGPRLVYVDSPDGSWPIAACLNLLLQSGKLSLRLRSKSLMLWRSDPALPLLAFTASHAAYRVVGR